MSASESLIRLDQTAISQKLNYIASRMQFNGRTDQQPRWK